MERFTLKDASDLTKAAKLRNDRFNIVYKANVDEIKKYAAMGDICCEFVMHEESQINIDVAEMLRSDGFFVTMRLGVLTIEWLILNKREEERFGIVNIPISPLNPEDLSGFPYREET